MKTGIWTATLIAGALTLDSAAAADKPLTSQQQKMSTCSQEAKTKGLKGDERQTFMSDCLKADSAPAANSQQEKMKDCNKQAAGKKGKERQDFMSKCLSGSATMAAPHTP
jgi:psiF repeat